MIDTKTKSTRKARFVAHRVSDRKQFLAYRFLHFGRMPNNVPTILTLQRDHTGWRIVYENRSGYEQRQHGAGAGGA